MQGPKYYRKRAEQRTWQLFKGDYVANHEFGYGQVDTYHGDGVYSARFGDKTVRIHASYLDKVAEGNRYAIRQTA